MTTSSQSDTDHIVEMEAITKTFGEVVALRDVTFELRRNEVLALAGDNGAGKSTLIKCLAGALRPDSGTIRVDGEVVEIRNPRQAKELGIETTFQDLAVAGNLTVAQNIFLGREEVTGPNTMLGVLDKRAMRERARELLEDLEIRVDVDEKVANLSGGERQLVSISRTLLSDPKIVIMDEPTSALSVEGAERVLELISQMQNQGISIILISHNLDYVQRAADRIHILHQGRSAGVIDGPTADRDDIVSRMVGGMPDEERGERPADV
ncbi:ATP-binding cassette domain-containing protein [Haloarcula nitratireducens]|uniref:ATP-binding cassette domain-containing protein n=1 Tax=Haloarcula nitratireducens TaxID=2487749 RepID=A0AAW4PH37_9EURY|nr:ATP-binding cassette domain-containing protein [Halomicroarcula nitratireducens]MBX0297294.1 ATP-binding cassette domain-containing protein [Halomicroarcula nitratireducens]